MKSALYGGAKPRPTRNFRAAGFISSLRLLINQGSSLLSLSVRSFASTAKGAPPPAGGKIPPPNLLDSNKLKLLRVQGHNVPAGGSLRGARSPLKDFFSSLVLYRQPRTAAGFNGIDDQASALETVGGADADDARRAGFALQFVHKGVIG